MAEHIGDDLSNGAKKAYNNAKNIRAAQKVATKLATGDAVGASISILQSETFRKIIAFILFFHMFLFFCVFFLVPISIYEGVSSYLQGLSEAWKNDYFLDDSNRFISFLKATGNAIGTMAEDAWSKITSFIPHSHDKDEDVGNEDEPTDEDLTVIGNKDSLKSVYNRKIDACIEKINSRALMIRDAINEQQGAIAGAAQNHFERNCLPNIEQTIKEENDAEIEIDGFKAHEYKYVYNGVNINVSINPSTKRNPKTERLALQLLSLYTTQFNIGDINELETSALLKWLGYSGHTKHGNIDFQLGDNENMILSIPAWKGEFLPQYLVEEAMQKEKAAFYEQQKKKLNISNNTSNTEIVEQIDEEQIDITESKYLKEYIKEHGCSLCDLILQVKCPNIYELSPVVTEEIEVKQNTVRKEVLEYHFEDNDFLPYKNASGEWIYNEKYWQETPSGKIIRKPFQYQYIVGRHFETVPAEIEETQVTTYYYSFNIPITINTRDIKEIVDIAGLWKGWLPNPLLDEMYEQRDKTA